MNPDSTSEAVPPLASDFRSLAFFSLFVAAALAAAGAASSAACATYTTDHHQACSQNAHNARTIPKKTFSLLFFFRAKGRALCDGVLAIRPQQTYRGRCTT